MRSGLNLTFCAFLVSDLFNNFDAFEVELAIKNLIDGFNNRVSICFLHITTRASFVYFLPIDRRFVTGYNQAQNLGMAFTKLLDEADAAHAGQRDVDKHKVRWV